MQSDSAVKRMALTIMASAMLASCGGSGGDSTATPVSGGNAVATYEEAGDHAVGSKDAPVIVIEYASVVCPACANWHNTVYPDFKKKYVETGKVRYVFREFPTSPERLAYAGFTIANCADESKFLQNIAVQFKRQRALVGAQDKGKAYEELAKASGLSLEEYQACLVDEGWKKEYDDGVKAARELGVNATPSFYVNGKMYAGKDLFKIEEFDDVLGPLLSENAAQEDAAE